MLMTQNANVLLWIVDCALFTISKINHRTGLDTGYLFDRVIKLTPIVPDTDWISNIWTPWTSLSMFLFLQHNLNSYQCYSTTGHYIWSAYFNGKVIICMLTGLLINWILPIQRAGWERHGSIWYAQICRHTNIHPYTNYSV